MSKKVTIETVAKLADVSISSVSRVINGSARVSREKQKRIEAALNQLGYRSQLIANEKHKSKLQCIGVLLQDLTSNYYTNAILGIEHALRKSGFYPVFISGHWDSGTEQEAIEVLLERHMAGILVIGGHLPDGHLRTLARQLPTVILDRHVKGLEKQCLTMNNVLGGYLATQHLIRLGHQHIAHITGDLRTLDARDRLQGYRQALLEADLPFNPNLVVEGNFNEPTGLMAMELLFSRGRNFTSVFVSNDQMALGVRLALFRRGIRVPEDVSLVGFDDIRGVDYMSPPLTTIKHPIYEMVQAAINHLIEMLGSTQPRQMPRFDPSLVVRESTRMLFTQTRNDTTH
ncbi:LacI family DNA-binding transcriptional regulator [Deinococcus misasensis]|uniref:LacI family DNA-binding transcriptional regulator n=1 Tax=Deinococcus misasensis TaxID=392413 RepID=UPI0005523B26|nr:substrate-binding domain-containing protein [Deinococcus misasensis]